MEGKQCCGYPRARVACCAVLSVLIAAAAITTTVVILTKAPDDIATIEKSESDSGTIGDFTVTRTAAFSSASSVVNGTLMFLDSTTDNSSTLSLTDFRIAATDCEELDIRLLGEASSMSSLAEGLLVVPLTGAANGTAADAAIDFTEMLGDDFDIDLYTQAALWCTTSDGTEEQLGSSVELATPTMEGGSMVVRQASLAGSGSYTAEGMVQILGTLSVVDGSAVMAYSMRFVDIDVSSGPDVFLYLTTDPEEPENVDAAGSLTVLLEEAVRGTFSFTGDFSQTVPDGFTTPEDYVAAVVWCDDFSVLFGSGLFEDV